MPPILLASIAMQESSCRPSLDGGDGSCGMMQLTKDKWPKDGSESKPSHKALYDMPAPTVSDSLLWVLS